MKPEEYAIIYEENLQNVTYKEKETEMSLEDSLNP